MLKHITSKLTNLLSISEVMAQADFSALPHTSANSALLAISEQLGEVLDLLDQVEIETKELNVNVNASKGGKQC